jgi:hypothetical protein
MPNDENNSKKVDELLDALADEMDRQVNAIAFAISDDTAMPSLEEIRALWDAINTELKNLDNLKKSDFLIKKGNEFYMLGMLLKSAHLMKIDRRTSILSGVSSSESLAKPDGFIRNNYKQAKKRLQ